MTQDNKNRKHFIADRGNVFQRIHNGFTAIENPIICGTELFLGNIIVDANGKMLAEPMPDKIEYYQEIEKPAEEEKPQVEQ